MASDAGGSRMIVYIRDAIAHGRGTGLMISNEVISGVCKCGTPFTGPRNRFRCDKCAAAAQAESTRKSKLRLKARKNNGQ